MEKKSGISSALRQARSPVTKPNISLASERLTNSEIEQLRQAQNDAIEIVRKYYPNLKVV